MTNDRGERAAREQYESEARLRLALEASHTGIWTWDLGTDAVVWTSECYAIHGVSEDTFGGTGAAFFRLVHPEDRTRVESAVRAAAADHALYRCEFRVVRPDGSVVWVNNLGRASYDADGRPTGMLGTIIDVTERKLAEAALKARERELQTLADNTPDIIARFDRELRHVFISAAVEKATGTSPAELIGKTNRELGMPADLCDAWDEAIRSVFATGQPRSIEFSCASPNGERHYASRIVPEVGLNGSITTVLSVASDVTDRVNAEKALRAALYRAERAVSSRDQLVSLVSHDLRNPLSTVTLGIATLRKIAGAIPPGPSSEQFTKILDRMERQAAHMNKQLEDLLDVARLHAESALSLERRAVDLVELTRAVAEEHQRASPGHQIDVRASEPVVGAWDAQRLVRVITNLASNAVKYSPRGGTVSITLETARKGDQTWAVLRVQDQGMGIPPREQAQIFEWFSRGESARRTSIPGTGIGLAGAREIVEQHGGSISVESEEGRGSTFTVRLPAEPPPALAPLAAPP